MSNVRVVTDSAADIPEAMVAEHDIRVVPLTIRFGNDEFVDRRDLSPAQFWARCAATSVLPETAAPAPGEFEAVFRSAEADGCPGVVCITLSSKLSATYQSAVLAAKAVADLIDVRVIDSLSITLGLGTMVLESAKLAETGADLDAVEKRAVGFLGRVKVYGALDTLDNLKKGGRIGGAQALIGSLLQVKPILDLSSGAVESPAKQRTRAKSLAHLAQMVREAKERHHGLEHLAVMHGAAPDLDQFLDLLAPHFPRDQIIVSDIGAVIGAHGGPRVIGVAFVVPAA